MSEVKEIKEINFYSRKKGFGWLSNFERCAQEVDGVIYITNEHYYQSQKAKNWMTKLWIINAPSPYLAMVAGRGLRHEEIIENWENIKIETMLKGLRAKFQDEKLRKKLLDTENAILHEDSPTDFFWGKLGKDMLGKLLMQVRDEIIEEENKDCQFD